MNNMITHGEIYNLYCDKISIPISMRIDYQKDIEKMYGYQVFSLGVRFLEFKKQLFLNCSPLLQWIIKFIIKEKRYGYKKTDE